jgi:hypothetical protein
VAASAHGLNLALERALAADRSGLTALLAAADAVDDWDAPLAPGKWSVGEHLDHIRLSYRALIRELRDAGSAALIGTALQRRLWRLVGLTSILWFGRLPRGARAPREVRPSKPSQSKEYLRSQLMAAARDYEEALVAAWPDRERRLTHPYFGSLTVAQAARVGAVHARHHARSIRMMKRSAPQTKMRDPRMP